jgi:hypothetical protein
MGESLLLFFSIFSALIPLTVSLLSFSKQGKGASRVIFIYLVYSFANDIATTVITDLDFLPHGTFFLNSFFTIIEHILFFLFFNVSINSKKFQLFIYLLSASFVLFASFELYKSFISGENSNFDSLSSSLSSIILISYSVILLYEKIQIPDSPFVYGTFEFWVVVGLMIYFAGTFFLFLQAKNFSKDEMRIFWKINLVSNILKNLFFAIAFYQKKKSAENLSQFNLGDN